MRTKLKRIGDDVALVLNEALREEFGLDESTEVDVSPRTGGFFVAPVHSEERARRFQESAEKIAEKYAGLFKKLAE